MACVCACIMVSPDPKKLFQPFSLLSILLLFLCSTYLAKATQEYKYFAYDQDTPGEFYPFCVEVTGVWPPPNSILQSTRLYSLQKHSGRRQYLFRVAFSRPVYITSHDTSSGYQPEIVSKPIKNKWLKPFKNSVAKALEMGGFNLSHVPPVFLSPSESVVERYYPFRIANWQGSSKEFLFYFHLPAEKNGTDLTLLQKVFLVIDGGRFYSFGKVRSANHPIFVQTTIIGEYYFDKYVKRNPWFKPKQPTLFKSSPYCVQRHPRPLSINQEPSMDKSQDDFMAWLNDGAHLVESVPGGSTPQLSLNLSLTVNGAGGSLDFKLPPAIKALYGKVNVSVKLPDQSTLKLQQPEKALKVFVPVKRVPVYEPRERIYHNTGLDLMMPVTPPAFATTSFTNREKDIVDGLFPKRIMVITKHIDFNVELVDMGTGVKVGQYYPLWEQRGFWEDKSLLTKKELTIKSKGGWIGDLQGLLSNVKDKMKQKLKGKRSTEAFAASKLSKMAWCEISRDGPIASRNSTRYRPQLFKLKQRLETKYKFLKDNNVQCSVNSKRTPTGRRGATMEHVIDYGPLYHLLEPVHFSSWSVENKGIEIMLTNDKGTKLSVSILGMNLGVDKNIPPSIVEGIQRYRCLLPPIRDIPKPESPQSVNEKWVHLDRCIFVPASEAKSEECGGLKRFKDLPSIASDPNFCDKPFGDCIGLPFTSLQRFPVIPTFGLHELTGWTPCSSSKCSLNAYQQHPVGRHSVDGRNTKAMPRSVLKFSKTKETPPNTKEDAVMEFRPSFTADSRMDYTVVLSGVEVLNPKLSAQPLVEGADTDPPPLSPENCDTVWQLHAEEFSLKSHHSREATLTTIVYNHGQGGRDFVFEVKCTKHIIVHPDNNIIQTWIEPKSSMNVTFSLNGELAASSPSEKHKCELTVKSVSEDNVALRCTKWLTTYYGGFKDPCHLKAPIPSLDLAYYVLPASQYETPKLQQFLDSSPLPEKREIELVKAITVSLLVPPEQENLLSMLHRITVACRSDDILVLQENLQTNTKPGTQQIIRNAVIEGDFTEPRKMYFIATREWMESQTTSDPLTSSCFMLLTAYSPNHVCRATRKVVQRMHVPLMKVDIEAIQGNRVFSFLYPWYGEQSDLVMTSLLLCLVAGISSAMLVTCGFIALGVCRRKLPKREALDRLKRDLDKAKESDKKYWEDPLMYVCSPTTSDKYNSCAYYGEMHHGPHFILHQWRATEPLDTRDIKHLKIAGTLKYKNQALPVMFGHVKKVYMHKAKDCANIWVQASSGMYLLPISTVIKDYVQSIVEFLQKQQFKEGCYKKLLEKKESVDMGESGFEQAVASEFALGEVADMNEMADEEEEQSGGGGKLGIETDDSLVDDEAMPLLK